MHLNNSIVNFNQINLLNLLLRFEQLVFSILVVKYLEYFHKKNE